MRVRVQRAPQLHFGGLRRHLQLLSDQPVAVYFFLPIASTLSPHSHRRHGGVLSVAGAVCACPEDAFRSQPLISFVSSPVLALPPPSAFPVTHELMHS